jgi:polar amino acid transport system substrate-binding protein
LVKEYFKGRRTPMMVNYLVNAGIIPSDVWIQDPDIGGRRIICEICRFFDFASFVIGCEPIELQAMCVKNSNVALVAADNLTVAIKYQDGSVAQIFYVAVGTVDLSKEYCEVYADESTAIMDNFCSTVCGGKRGKKKLKAKQEKGFLLRRSELSSIFISSHKKIR